MNVNQRLYDSNIIMQRTPHGRHSDGVGTRRPHPQGNSGSYEDSLDQRRYRPQSAAQNVAQYLKAEPGNLGQYRSRIGKSNFTISQK